jgi:hypothetical protein
MSYETTPSADVATVYEQPDNTLAQSEMERLFKCAEQIKARKAERMTVERHATTGRLYIKVWRAA